MPEKKETPADPYANVTAETVDKLFENNSGRTATPIPPSIVALVEQSWGDGSKPVALRVPVTGGEKPATELRKLLQKAGERHDPPLTVRTTFDKDEKGTPVAVRFQAGKKVTRTTADTATAPATPDATATPDAKTDAA